MRPHRIRLCLAVAPLVALSLLTGEGAGVVRAEPALQNPDRPRLVSISPLGTISRRQVFRLFLDRQSGKAVLFGYFQYVHGLDENDLYQEGSGAPESKALFTLHLQANVTRVHQNGPHFVYEARGVSSVFFDDTPDGNFSDPETFRDGILIAQGEENAVYTYDPATGIGIGDVRLRQIGAWPFEFHGALIQFGAKGNQNVSWRGKTIWDWFNWTLVAATSTTVQANPLPGEPPP